MFPGGKALRSHPNMRSNQPPAKLTNISYESSTQFSCPYCFTSFTHERNLIRHMRIPGNPCFKKQELEPFIVGPPYTCSICNTNFTLKSSLKKHQENQRCFNKNNNGKKVDFLDPIDTVLVDGDAGVFPVSSAEGVHDVDNEPSGVDTDIDRSGTTQDSKSARLWR